VGDEDGGGDEDCQREHALRYAQREDVVEAHLIIDVCDVWREMQEDRGGEERWEVWTKDELHMFYPTD